MQPHEQFAEFEIAGVIESHEFRENFPGLKYNVFIVRVRKFNTFTLYFSDELIKAHDIHIGQLVHTKGSFQRPMGNDSEVIFSVSEVLS